MRAPLALAVALAVALLLCAARPAAALYDRNSAVVTLTSDNFRDLVLQSPHVWVVEFFAPWCGHCQRLKPDYEKAAGNLKGLVKVGAIDCDSDKNKQLCGSYDVRGFPTIKVFPSADKKNPTDYQGERSARAIVDFAVNQLPSFVKKVATKTSKLSMTLDAFLADQPQAGKLSHAILFTSKSATTPLFKALSVEFKDRLLLGEVASTDSDIVARYGVSKFPTLIVVPKDTPDEPVVYSGALKSEDLLKFLAEYALPPTKGGSSSSSSSSSSESKKEPFDPAVHFAGTQADLEKLCLGKPIGTCIITFAYVDREFEESVAAHEETLKVLRNLKKKAYDNNHAFHFLWVDAIKQQAMREAFGVSDMFPSVVAITPNRKVFRPFVGGFEEDSLQEFLTDYQMGKGGRFFKFTHDVQLKE